MPYCQAKENDANTKRYSLRERTNLALTSSPSLQNTSKNKPNVSGRKPSLRSAPARKKPCIGPCCAKQTATKSTKKTNPATRSPVRNVSRKLDLNPGVLTKRCSVRLNRLPHGEDKPTRTCVYSTEQTGPEESLKDPHCEDKSALYEFKVDGDEKSTSKNVVKKPKRGRKGHDSDASDSEYLPSRFDPRRYKRSIAVLTRTRDKNKSNNQNTIVNDGESSEMNLSENLVVKDTDGSLSTSFNPTEDSNLSLIHLSTDTSVQSEAPSFFTRSNRSNVSPVKNLSTLTTPDKCDNSNKENIINIPPLTSTFSDRKIKRFGRRTAYLSPSDVTNINLVLEDSFDSPPSKVPFKTQGTGTKLSETLHKYNQILKSSANTPPNSRLEVPQKAVHFSLDSSLGTLASRVTFIENSPKSPVNAHHTNKIAVKNSSQQTPGINRQSGPLIKTSSTRSLGGKELLQRNLKEFTNLISSIKPQREVKAIDRSCPNITSPRNPKQEVKAIDRSCLNITSPRNPEQEVKAIDRSCLNITSPRNPEQEVKAIDRSCSNITSPRNPEQEVKAIDRSCLNITSPRNPEQEVKAIDRSCLNITSPRNPEQEVKAIDRACPNITSPRNPEREVKAIDRSCLNITSPRNPEQEVKAIDRSCSNITSPRNPEQEVKAIDRSCPNITSPRNPEQEVKAIDRSCPNITSPRNRKQEVKAIDRSCSNITSPRDRKQEDESVERSCPLRLSVGMTHSYSKSEGPGLDSLFGFDQDDLEEELLSPVKLSSETKRPQVKFAVCSTPDSGKTTHKNGVLPWRPAVNSAPAARPRSRAGNNSSSSHSETISLCDAAESRTTDSSKTLEGRTLPQRPAVDSATSVRQRNRARKNSSSSSHSNTVSLCDRTECPPLLSDPAESHSSLVGDTSVTKRRQPVQSTMDMYLSSTCPPDKSPQHESKSMTKQKTDLVSCNPHIYDEDPNIPVVFNKPPRHSYERKQRGKRCMSEERWEETAQLAEEQHESSKQRRKRTKKHVEEDKKIEDLCASLNSKFKEVEDFELCVE